MPWYGIMLCCIGFGIWSMVCSIVGASIVQTTRRQADIVREASKAVGWPNVPNDISEMED